MYTIEERSVTDQNWKQVPDFPGGLREAEKGTQSGQVELISLTHGAEQGLPAQGVLAPTAGLQGASEGHMCRHWEMKSSSLPACLFFLSQSLIQRRNNLQDLPCDLTSPVLFFLFLVVFSIQFRWNHLKVGSILVHVMSRTMEITSHHHWCVIGRDACCNAQLCVCVTVSEYYTSSASFWLSHAVMGSQACVSGLCKHIWIGGLFAKLLIITVTFIAYGLQLGTGPSTSPVLFYVIPQGRH